MRFGDIVQDSQGYLTLYKVLSHLYRKLSTWRPGNRKYILGNLQKIMCPMLLLLYFNFVTAVLAFDRIHGYVNIWSRNPRTTRFTVLTWEQRVASGWKKPRRKSQYSLVVMTHWPWMPIQHGRPARGQVTWRRSSRRDVTFCVDVHIYANKLCRTNAI